MKWTREQEAFLSREYDKGTPVVTIAERLGVSAKSAGAKIARLGLRETTTRPYSPMNKPSAARKKLPQYPSTSQYKTPGMPYIPPPRS